MTVYLPQYHLDRLHQLHPQPQTLALPPVIMKTKIFNQNNDHHNFVFLQCTLFY